MPIVKDARPLLVAEANGRHVPYLSIKEFSSGGKVFLLNCHTFSEADFRAVGEILLPPWNLSFLDLPNEWIQKLRNCFNAPLFFQCKVTSRIAFQF